jgi:hypothetical protein
MGFRRGLEHIRKYLPLPTQPAAEKAFTTYKNYLLHLERGLGGVYGIGSTFVPSLAAAVRALPKFSSVARRALTPRQEAYVVSGLRIAWAKELQLRIPGAFDVELLPFLIHGSAIPAYYVAFHEARALFAAAGQVVGPTHAATLNTLSSWVADRDLFPAPWSVHCVGGPRRTDMKFLGKPTHATSSGTVSPLASVSPTTVWDSLDMFIGTTRDRQIEEKKQQWRVKNKKKNVPRAGALSLCADLRPTTLFNAAYRLRKRSDYSDADAFLDGIQNAKDAEDYHRSIALWVHGTLTVFETLIVAYCGPSLYRDAAVHFLSVATGPGSEALRERKIDLVGP